MSLARPRALPTACWLVLLVAAMLLSAPGARAVAVVGEIDPAFNGGVQQQQNLVAAAEQGMATYVQPDGKILVAGTVNDGSKDIFAVSRFHGTGALDTSWGTNGVFTMAFGSGGGASAAYDITMHGTRILVAGYGTWGSNSDMVVTQLTSSGALDAGNFGSSGYITIPFGGGDIARGITTDATGRVFVVGTDGADWRLARLSATGSGLVTQVWDFAGGYDTATSVAIDPGTGKLYVAGTGEQSGFSDVVVRRYDTNLVLDGTFGGGGTYTRSIGALGDDVGGIAVDSVSGDVVVAASSHYSTLQSTDVSIIRLTSSGLPDADWNPDADGDGLVTRTWTTSSSEQAHDIGIDADGKVLVSGTMRPSPGTERVTVLRYHADGTLDLAWSSDGATETTNVETASPAYGGGLAIAGSRDVVVVGSAMQGGNLRTFVARYHGGSSFASSGSTFLDTSACMSNTLAFDFGSMGPGEISVTDGTCAISFGHSSQSAALRVFQSDGYGVAMEGASPAHLSDYSSGAWGAATGSLFGACLSNVANADALTPSTRWTQASGGMCMTDDVTPWYPIPATSSSPGGTIATSAAGQNATATLTFGARTATLQPPGAYEARLSFVVMDPNL